jgi:hypothetical protein
MRKSSQKLALIGASVAMACGMGMLSASPAGASVMARASCDVVTSHCESATVKANSGAWVDYYVSAGVTGTGCSWRVVDNDNGAIVGSGRIGAFANTDGRISGLYGYYRLELYNCATSAWGYVENT